jgi:hypothetical protein
MLRSQHPLADDQCPLEDVREAVRRVCQALGQEPAHGHRQRRRSCSAAKLELPLDYRFPFGCIVRTVAGVRRAGYATSSLFLNMNKTPCLGSVVALLAELNDQLCFFLFAENELRRQFPEFSEKALQLYIPDTFAQNKYAKNINKPLAEMPSYLDKSRSFTFGSYFSTSYEIATTYFESVMNLFEEVNHATFKRKKKIGNTTLTPEESLEASINVSGYAPLPDELIKTMSYFRLRRNHFIHQNTVIASKLADMITLHGALLNTYWKGSVDGLDFTNRVTDVLHETETIDMIKLIRVTLRGIDNLCASMLDANGVLRLIGSREAAQRAVRLDNSDARAQLAKAVKGLAKMEYGLVCTEQEALAAVSALPLAS